MELSFSIPREIDEITLAETFNVYLIGPRAYRNEKRDSNEERPHGPFKAGEKWQLDGSNDYWMRFDATTKIIRISCRYDGQAAVLSAMQGLFQARCLR